MASIIWLFLALHTASALTIEKSPSPNPILNREILTVMPPLQFAVDDRLKRNVEFWTRINTQYTTQQGLIHDAKYIDHIYEVLDLRGAGRRPAREAKKK